MITKVDYNYSASIFVWDHYGKRREEANSFFLFFISTHLYIYFNVKDEKQVKTRSIGRDMIAFKFLKY